MPLKGLIDQTPVVQTPLSRLFDVYKNGKAMAICIWNHKVGKSGKKCVLRAKSLMLGQNWFLGNKLRTRERNWTAWSEKLVPFTLADWMCFFMFFFVFKNLYFFRFLSVIYMSVFSFCFRFAFFPSMSICTLQILSVRFSVTWPWFSIFLIYGGMCYMTFNGFILFAVCKH